MDRVESAMKTRSHLFLLLLAFAAGAGSVLALRQPTMAPHDARNPAPGAETYYCPMHPSYRSDHPGNCPVCNMKLIPLEEGMESEQAAGVEGHATVTIQPERRQLIGVRTGLVERRPVTRTIRAVGRVEVDERKLAAVSLKYGGWVEELHVKATGENVAVGEPLFTLYSPELLEAQKTYLLARAAQLGELAESARQKLVLWDMTEEQIGALEAAGQAERVTTVVSRKPGTVTRREAVAGARVEPGATLYELTDLSTVWIHAEVYEAELPAVRVGDEATLELESLPGERLAGRIVYVYPYLDETTRTARVRIEADNASGRLAPGMFATVSIAVDLGEQLVIDDGAILDTGRRKLVFVALGEGRFEPREVTLAQRGEGQAVVLAGLEENERVLTSGNFLVDSESRLKAALLQHAGGGHEHH
jgi:Cu(I)/Ag(I) efflux system membrane fusion protein